MLIILKKISLYFIIFSKLKKNLIRNKTCKKKLEVKRVINKKTLNNI